MGLIFRKHRSLLVVLAANLFCFVCNAGLAENGVQVRPAVILEASNLERDAELSRHQSIPILLYFSDHHCGYCRKLENEILLPLLRSGEYDDRVLLRKIPWLSQRAVRSFDASKGESLDYQFRGPQYREHQFREYQFQDIATQYQIQVTPTLVFVDYRGRELGRRILGYSGADFFWFYLDRSINEALTAIEQRATSG